MRRAWCDPGDAGRARKPWLVRPRMRSSRWTRWPTGGRRSRRSFLSSLSGWYYASAPQRCTVLSAIFCRRPRLKEATTSVEECGGGLHGARSWAWLSGWRVLLCPHSLTWSGIGPEKLETMHALRDCCRCIGADRRLVTARGDSQVCFCTSGDGMSKGYIRRCLAIVGSCVSVWNSTPAIQVALLQCTSRIMQSTAIEASQNKSQLDNLSEEMQVVQPHHLTLQLAFWLPRSRTQPAPCYNEARHSMWCL